MKKRIKLSLRAETVRVLTDVAGVHGGQANISLAWCQTQVSCGSGCTGTCGCPGGTGTCTGGYD